MRNVLSVSDVLQASISGTQEPRPGFPSEARVALDVVASDRSGQPVSDLRQDELRVFVISGATR
jgi:hypothetical protein